MLTSIRSRRTAAYTLTELMIAVGIIALIAAIAVPWALRARQRTQATLILNELRLLDAALEQYAAEANKNAGDPFSWADLKPYIKADTRLHRAFAADGTSVNDPLGSPYRTFGHIEERAPEQGSIYLSRATAERLSQVADPAFWQPYGVEPAPVTVAREIGAGSGGPALGGPSSP